MDAGGDCSVAVRVTRGSVLSTGVASASLLYFVGETLCCCHVFLNPAPGSLPKGVLQSLDSSQLLVEARVAIAREDFEPLKKRLRDVFGSPSCVSASFLTRSEVWNVLCAAVLGHCCSPAFAVCSCGDSTSTTSHTLTLQRCRRMCSTR